MSKQEFYVVYAGSSKLGLTDKDRPTDICKYQDHAEILIKKLWPTTGYFKIISKKGLLELIKEEFE